MKQVWTLENFFKGGSHSKEFQSHIDSLEKKVQDFSLSPLDRAFLEFQDLSSDFDQANSFVTCSLAQDVHDKKAKEHEAHLTKISASIASLNASLSSQLKELSDQEFEKLFQNKELEKVRFTLTEKRILAQKRLSLEKEALIEELSINGYHGWGQFYNLLVGSLKFNFQGKELSQGQIENELSHGDRTVRQEAFSLYINTYNKHADQFGAILNNLSGFRTQLYAARKWESILDEPCDLNRLSEQTLNTMWSVIASHKAPLIAYLRQKSHALDLPKLSWYDLDAPLGELKSDIPYTQGAQFIIDQFEKISPKMAAFSRHALNSAWVEAEDRKGKRPGGFCINFPKSKETRIFMTYSNKMTNVTTLAHELGHAFHADCCFDLAPFNQHYAMNVAETASTMAEMIVADAAYREAKNPAERLGMLDDKLSRAVAYLMNLHARFLFETRFYERRRKGFVPTEELCALMLDAQKEAYGDTLAEYHPYFWASKMHFYFTEWPFYNFPYTFGYLFSLGLYAELKKEPATFEARYIALLQDTARMGSEELARKHLALDLTKPGFWQSAINLALADVDDFIGEPLSQSFN